jgi:hypothetical protein
MFYMIPFPCPPVRGSHFEFITPPPLYSTSQRLFPYFSRKSSDEEEDRQLQHQAWTLPYPRLQRAWLPLFSRAIEGPAQRDLESLFTVGYTAPSQEVIYMQAGYTDRCQRRDKAAVPHSFSPPAGPLDYIP